MFKISIENFNISTIIGILEDERENEQQIIVNLEIDYQLREEFLNYSKVIEIVEELFIQKEYYLIEDALVEIPTILKDIFYTISNIKLKITKPDIVKNADVSVSTEKSFRLSSF